jgi:hypothetical protein
MDRPRSGQGRISCHTVHLGDVLLDFLGASIAVHRHLELHSLHQTEHARQINDATWNIINHGKVGKTEQRLTCSAAVQRYLMKHCLKVDRFFSPDNGLKVPLALDGKQESWQLHRRSP